MNPLVPPPTPADADVAARIAETLTLWTKIGGALLMLWGFIEKVAKPYHEWRKDSLARTIAEVLAPHIEELEARNNIRTQSILAMLREFFGDHDRMLDVVMDNRERHDEMTDLLNAIGLSSERRTDEERRQMVDLLVGELRTRRRDRQRRVIVTDTDELQYPPPEPE